MKRQDGPKKLVFLTDVLYRKDNMLRIFCQKISWLAENSEYEIYLVLTEKTRIPARYELSPKVIIVSLDVNYERLKKKEFLDKYISYVRKLYTHRKRLKKFLYQVRPVATVSMMGRELLFLSRIRDGSQKIYEFHYDIRSCVAYSKGQISVFVYLLLQWYNIIKVLFLIRRRDVVVADTETITQKLKRYFKNIVFIPNPLKDYPPVIGKNESKKVMAIGDFLSERGFSHLIDVWERNTRKFPDWRLHLYGDGNQERYRDMIKSRRLGRVIQCYERPNNLYDTYPKYAIFVQAYGFDKFGRHLMEAMALGIPCVAYDVPYGPGELIRDELNGFLVNPNYLLDFSSKVGMLMRNEEKRMTMGLQAHEDVGRYEVNRVMDEWMKLYNSISFRKKRYLIIREK